MDFNIANCAKCDIKTLAIKTRYTVHTYVHTYTYMYYT